MKTIIATIFLSFLATTSFANKIDDLKSDEDVEKFLHQQDKRFKEFYVADLNTLYYDSIQRKIADSLGVKPWQKVDFDNNGLTDLLVYGHLSGENYLIAFIDEGEKFIFRSLNRGPFDNLYFPIVTTSNGQTFLLLHKGAEFSRNKNDYKKIIKTERLIYKFGNFIEPNFNPSSYKIEKIEFATTMCFGTCPVFELKINSDRTAEYNALQYNDEEGKFKTIMDTSNYNSIITLLNYVDFPKLQNNYAVNWTDDQTCTLTITYNNEQTKTITDYGEIGTNGLRIIYDRLFALRKNQKWK